MFPFLHIFALLAMGHFVADYPLQGDFLAKGKNRFAPLPGVPWFWCMTAHCAIHAGFVWLFTGSPLLAACEFLIHFIIDDLKCAGRFGFTRDQVYHLGYKAAWAAYIVFTYHAISR